MAHLRLDPVLRARRGTRAGVIVGHATAPTPARPPAPERLWVVFSGGGYPEATVGSAELAERTRRALSLTDEAGRPFAVHAYRREGDSDAPARG